MDRCGGSLAGGRTRNDSGFSGAFGDIFWQSGMTLHV